MGKDDRIIEPSSSASFLDFTALSDKDEKLDGDGNSSRDTEAGSVIGPTPEKPAHGTNDTDTDSGPEPLSPPPDPQSGVDTGLVPWLQVLGSTMILASTWGVINTFGVFQSYYESTLLPTSTSSQISWIGSLQASLLFLVGVVSGPLFDAGYFRHLLWAGSALVVLGQFMTSLCTAYWQVLLAQGVCIGVGMGLLFLPSAAIVSQYFVRRRALALGISSAGSPVAGIVFPIIFSELEPRVGFGWATRVIAFILLALAVPPLLFMRTRTPPSGKMRALFDPSALRDVPLVMFSVGGFFAFLTLYVPFFYITVFATDHGVSTPQFAPYLVTLMNAGSIFGRLIPNAVADRWGSFNVLMVCNMASMVLAFAWIGIKNQAGAIVFAMLYGAFSGGLVSLSPSVIMSLNSDMSLLGTRMGMNFLCLSVSILIGTPIAGAILGDFTEAEWLGMMGYGGGGLLVATVLFVICRFVIFKSNGRWKA